MHLERENDFSFDVPRIAAHPWLAEVLFLEEARSTNDVALQRGSASATDTPLLVLARRQTQGRGRGSNRWWANDGALTFSLLIEAHQVPVPTTAWPQLPLFTGLAVARALRPLLPADMVQLKWPNDIYLRQRKLGGILVETTSGVQPKLVVGIGLNVNNSVSAAPPEIAARATSLSDSLRAPLSLTDVLLAVITGFSEMLDDMQSSSSELLRQWRQLCLLTGRRIEVASGPRHICGVCMGIDDSGALCIETQSGLERCFAGVVVRVE